MKHLPAILLTATLVAVPTHAPAGEIGHQGASSFNPGDFFAPPEGFIFSLYVNYYETRALRDGAGNKLNSFDLFGTPVSLDINVESFQIIPMFIWSPGVKILGADYSTLVMPIYGQTSLAADLSAAGRSVGIAGNAWGIQESYVQPLWLTWRTAE